MAGFVNRYKTPLYSVPSCAAKRYLRIFSHFPTHPHCSGVIVDRQKAKADLSRIRGERSTLHSDMEASWQQQHEFFFQSASGGKKKFL